MRRKQTNNRQTATIFRMNFTRFSQNMAKNSVYWMPAKPNIPRTSPSPIPRPKRPQVQTPKSWPNSENPKFHICNLRRQRVKLQVSEVSLLHFCRKCLKTSFLAQKRLFWDIEWLMDQFKDCWQRQGPVNCANWANLSGGKCECKVSSSESSIRSSTRRRAGYGKSNF